ncbi:MAG: c-type cytochrome [Actinomycetota bacterium]|nr:c-type cytochrome [Actinomycetota bacterium]
MRGSQASRLPRPAVLATVIFLLFLAIVLAASADQAAAKSGFLGDFNAAYGTAGTPLDSCSLCHTNVPSLNGYGTDWRDNSKNFAAIEPLDSDGDGWTNIQEIQARSMPGSAASTPPPPTTTQPPGTTQPPSTTQPPPTTQPPTTTLPPPGNGPLTLRVTEFKPPGSVDVNGGSVSRELKVKARVDNAEEDENVTAQIQLYANGQLVQTISETEKAEDDGEAKFEVKFNFTFTTSHVPKIDWWAIIVVDGQASSAATATTTVIGPAPPTTTTQPPGTTQPPTTTLPPGTTQPPSTTQPPPGGINGAAIYAASCAGCHGADGSGGFGGPVAGTSMSLGQIVTITANGSGGMPGFTGQLSAAEIDAVSAFVLTLGGGAPPPPTTTTTLPPGTPPGSGAALYRQYCASCHGANADGGIGGPLVGSSLSFSQQVSVTSQGRGTMPGFNSTLTSGEIDSIIRYVANLGNSGSVTTTTTVPPDEESGSSIYGRLCAACHGGDGAGGPGGPILGTSFHGSSLAGVITNGVGTMPAFGGQLNDGQVTRLVAYVEALSRGEVTIDGDAEDLLGDVLVDPAEGFNGHISESGATGEDSVVALGAAPSASPLPVGNPLGWSLALAIAAVMIAVGSAFTGAMPKDLE